MKIISQKTTIGNIHNKPIFYLDIPIDTNILVPTNLPDDFKILNLKIIVSGKKNIKENHVLTLPDIRVGFGYSFEITTINRNN